MLLYIKTRERHSKRRRQLSAHIFIMVTELCKLLYEDRRTPYHTTLLIIGSVFSSWWPNYVSYFIKTRERHSKRRHQLSVQCLQHSDLIIYVAIYQDKRTSFQTTPSIIGTLSSSWWPNYASCFSFICMFS